ncbi:hypothetical protein KBB85_06600, partial [Patescibacteria group bacterium]|nr:hypothetical protein [Patescibacteria group bacterium]
ENNAEKKKEPMPQIDEVSGLSGDYSNEFNPFDAYNPDTDPSECVTYFVEDATPQLRKNRDDLLVKKYEERYPPTRYAEVVTAKNQEDVAEINAAVEKIQEFYREKIRTHLLAEPPLKEGVKKDIIELVKEIKALGSRVRRMAQGEVISVPGKDAPLNAEYLNEIEPLRRPATSSEWYDLVQATIAANQGRLLPKYTDQSDPEGSVGDVSSRRQKRIDHIQAMIVSLNRSMAGPEIAKAVQGVGVEGLVKSVRPMFLQKLMIIERMIKAEAA